MNHLPQLICGLRPTGTAEAALKRLGTSIRDFSSKAHKFLQEEISDDALMFGPFCARALLENSCAALLGRMDPFRMLYLSEFQAQPEYECGKRAFSAFSWFGDVIPDDKAAAALWNINNDVSKISRALFSKHVEHVFWKPAIDSAVDFVSSLPADPALSDILALSADNYINQTKGRGAQLYSTLSKGVHWEFFTNTLVFDESTVKSAIRDTFLIIGDLGLISHFMPTAYGSMKPKEAVDHYICFRRLVP